MSMWFRHLGMHYYVGFMPIWQVARSPGWNQLILHTRGQEGIFRGETDGLVHSCVRCCLCDLE
jgi:hypothetical protein